MAASVLGKRTRGAESAGVQTRSSKRLAEAGVVNDENRNPFVTSSPSTTSDSRTEKTVIIGNALNKGAQRTPRPRKHPSPQHKVAASPNTINAHFKVAKPSVGALGHGHGHGHEKEKAPAASAPQTPRHRDALSKKVAVTPSHRARVTGAPLTPATPSTPSRAGSSVYNQARQIFSRCTNPDALVGRDDERVELSAFVSERIDSALGGCLYISGPPGTGKSALVGELCQAYAARDGLAFSTINCMSIRNAKDFASTLAQDLGLGEDAAAETDFKMLQSCFLGENGEVRKHLVILDEIDRLVELDLKLLYTLFEWSMQPTSKLILIGIANALDLTDRFLPRLKARNLKPHLLPFMPYTGPQIAAIITSKLKALVPDSATNKDHVPFLHPAAILFCSKKVAAQTESPSKTPLMENINLSSPPVQRTPSKLPRQAKLASSIGHLTVETAPRATIAHMAKVTALVFSNGTSQRLQSLNLQQKAVLCALSASEERRRDSPSTTTNNNNNNMTATPSKTANAAPTVKQLFEAYTLLCKRENLLHPLTSVEFRDVVAGLETLSLVSPVEGRNGSFAVPITPTKTPGRKARAGFAVGAAPGDERRLASCVGFKELADGLQGPGSEILKEILEGDALL
ncbi:AAA ATPase [Taxawa tesnikishii (nom. ined.)]|nr:AAA ATPase [Dothideales sp. JES 119]